MTHHFPRETRTHSASGTPVFKPYPKEAVMADTQDEKEEEKQHEKEDEKRNEKSFDEKWRSNPLSALIWAGILIWAGLVLLAENLGLFSSREGLESWNVILAGAGVLVLIEALVRYTMPAYKRPITGTVIFGLILLGVALGGTRGWELVWPLLLIVAGVGLLFGFMRQRK
jgi:hypothetical protein